MITKELTLAPSSAKEGKSDTYADKMTKALKLTEFWDPYGQINQHKHDIK